MGKCFDLLSNSLDCFCEEMYKSIGEFECGCWGLKARLLFHLKIDFLIGMVTLWFYMAVEKDYTPGSRRLLQIIL